MDERQEFLEDNFVVLTKPTLDLLLRQDISGDLLSVYTFYYYTAKWQKTNQIKCTTGFTATGLNWSETKVRRCKKLLIDLGLIENATVRDKQNVIVGHYIKINYLLRTETQKEAIFHTVENPQDGKCHSVGNQDTNAYSTNNLNAYSTNSINAYSTNSEKGAKPKRAKFIPPVIDECITVFKENGSTENEANAFFDYYEANGWTQGKGKAIKDWKAAARGWIRRSAQYNYNTQQGGAADGNHREESARLIEENGYGYVF